ncbi:unnamed protein product [Nyctereutes procyonoides]|uniref:(raccoon dog) hypothetical protein n=1 Tax=Nyctereutes procyonoides TaxID=34880 RepID=A0A811YNQ1_NYCPR|nr:unnamed protein product [Nyctereutes procyonoides]
MPLQTWSHGQRTPPRTTRQPPRIPPSPRGGGTHAPRPGASLSQNVALAAGAAATGSSGAGAGSRGPPGGHCCRRVLLHTRTGPARWARPEPPRLSPRRGAAAAHQASHSATHKALPGSARHAAARRPTAHLRPRVSHFSDGLTDSTAAPADPAAAAAAAATTCLPAQHRFAPP